MTEMMKAVRQHAFGGPEVLSYEDAPIPRPARGEIRIRVLAASLNPPDWYLRDGYRALPPEWRPEGRAHDLAFWHYLSEAARARYMPAPGSELSA